MKEKHTPGKVKLSTESHNTIVLDNNDCGDPLDGSNIIATAPEKANAEHIRDCWNALEDINPAAVPKMVEALEGACGLLSGGKWSEEKCDKCDGLDRCPVQEAIRLAREGGE
jgi:hypothetical protein